MAYAKINSVTNANMAKVSNVAKAALGKIGGIDAPSASFADDYSILFDGTNDQVNANDAGAVMSGDLGSVSMWFKMEVSAYSLCLFYFEVDSNNRLLIYHHGGRNEFTMEHKGGGTERAIIDTTTVEGNGWHHFAYTWSTGENQSVLYIDGSSIDTDNASSDFTGTEDAIDFGKRRTHAWGEFEGNMNDIALFSDVLESGEVSAIYNSGSPKDESSHSGLVAYWKMENNTDDSSSNSNSLTLVNGATYSGDVP